METALVARCGISVVAQSKSLSGRTPAHANLSRNSCRVLPVHGCSCNRSRLLCRALPLNDVDTSEKTAVKGTLEVLEEDVQKVQRNYKRKVGEPTDEVASPEDQDGAVGWLVKTLANFVFDFLQYTPLEEENIYASRNFGPVQEIGDRVPVEVISGAIPRNFPAGTFIRTGPNPVFGGKFYKSKLGITKYHWFEGDGMLHAVYVEKSGNEYQLFYKNKYVETKGYLIEKEEGKPIVLATLVGTPWPLLINMFLNQLRFGFLAKPTGNTSLWRHGGRVFAAAEHHLPHEIDISDLSTMGEFNCKGAWPLDNFTVHPKIDPKTNELIFQGCTSMGKPSTTVGIISADGETLAHMVNLDFERSGFNHDIAITERYTVVMDFPLLLDPVQVTKGKPAIMFDPNSFGRFAILPRFGDSESVRWFPVETNFMFHIFNAYENGNEIVMHGLRTKSAFFNVDVNLDRTNWYRRGVTPGVSDQDAYDSLVDGALLTYIHEWRFDLEAGTVRERDIDDKENYAMMEFPRINESYVGRKYRYGYAICVDLAQARKTGLPYFGSVSKVDFSSTESGKGQVKVESHDFGPNRYGSEPVFVARPGSREEDDGWIVTYVHDESTDVSEAIIIDAQKFTEEPVARIRLPQRVPYGFHGTFVHAG